MNFVFLFFRFSLSRGKISEFPELSIEYKGDQEYDINEAVQPLSRYGFITALTGDDDLEHEVLKCAMLAYTMWLSNPNYDRILLISTKFDLPEIHETRLARLYTRVYFSPFVQFPCNKSLWKESDKHFWYKLNALTVTAYEKLLWVGPNIFIVRNVDPLFALPVPAAPPDYQFWNFSEYGPVHNFDFFIFKPSLDDFKELRSRGCDWIEHPEYSEEREKGDRKAFLGAYDNGLFEDFYKEEIITMPKYACFEVPGIKGGAFTKREEETDPRIIAYRFSNGNMPWDKPEYIVSEAWAYTMQKMFEALGDQPEYADKSILVPSSNTSAHLLTSVYPEVKTFTKDEILETYKEFNNLPESRIIVNSVCIIAASIGALSFVLIFTVSFEPEKKKEKQTLV